MQEIIIQHNEAGQRFDKFLFKYFKSATPGFIYKMLRKKNIVLNGKKSDGKDKLSQGDIVKIFMADETIAKFRAVHDEVTSDYLAHYIKPEIVYEDEDVLIASKPAGMLSQKADKDDVSINEHIIGYLISSGQLSESDLQTFKPGICNRLDRNTSGLIVAGKSLRGLQLMSKMFHDRTMDKYYLTVVFGTIDSPSYIKGYLKKNAKTNKVIISQEEAPDSQPIETSYEPLANGNNLTLLKVKLITGRTHQIRSHLASIGHAIVGDYKYGNKKENDLYKEKHLIAHQLLHSWQFIFPNLPYTELSNKTVTAEVPEIFRKFVEQEIGFKELK